MKASNLHSRALQLETARSPFSPYSWWARLPSPRVASRKLSTTGAGDCGAGDRGACGAGGGAGPPIGRAGCARPLRPAHIWGGPGPGGLRAVTSGAGPEREAARLGWDSWRLRMGQGAAAMPSENIFLFVPNLIGYARIVFAIISFYFMPCCPLTASSFYLLSGLLDAFDGYAARILNQGTRFGAMLDMLTDRCATMCLLVNLALLYPRATLLFQLSMSLDVASHWLHLHSSVVRGSESHKMIDLSGNPVLRIYYTSRPALFTLCAGNELFYCLLYLLSFSEGPSVGSVGLFRLGLWVTAPIALMKSLISVVHLITAARNMAALDAADRAKKK